LICSGGAAFDLVVPGHLRQDPREEGDGDQ
jgi:hypothetical protein